MHAHLDLLSTIDLVPPCVVEMRTDHPDNRAERNLEPGSGVYVYRQDSVRFANAGDGDAVLSCPGLMAGCQAEELM